MRLVAFTVLATTLGACATAPAKPDMIAGRFVINEALAGQTVGRGEFRAINGVQRSFVVSFDGRMEGDTFVLAEQIRYAIGDPENYTWRLRRTEKGEWRGTREGVIGEARGYQDGDVFRLTYSARIGGRTLKFRDMFYLEPGGTVVNRANAGLYGVNVAKVDIRITREELTS